MSIFLEGASRSPENCLPDPKRTADSSLRTTGIDESMVLYWSLHSAIQFCKGKTSEISIYSKLWMLCGVDGFPYNFDMHCRKDYQRTTSLRTHVVTSILSPVSSDKQPVFSLIIFYKPLLVVWPGCQRYQSLRKATIR